MADASRGSDSGTGERPHAALAERIAALTADDELAEQGGVRTRLTQLTKLTVRSARSAGLRAVASGRWAADIALEAAGHLPVRDEETLRDHHGPLTDGELARRLVDRAALVTAGIGVVVGGLAAAEELNPATWPTLPVELLAETLLVVAVEMKVVAELHVVAGRPIGGTVADQAVAVSRAWAERRGIDPAALIGTGGSDLLGRQARHQLARTLQRRILRRGGRSAFSLAPFLAGAAAGGVLNRKATRALGDEMIRSLQLPPG